MTSKILVPPGTIHLVIQVQYLVIQVPFTWLSKNHSLGYLSAIHLIQVPFLINSGKTDLVQVEHLMQVLFLLDCIHPFNMVPLPGYLSVNQVS